MYKSETKEEVQFMKTMKRLAAMLLAVCLMVPCVQLAVQAADGIIFFSDLTDVKVGEEFTIKGSVKNRGGNLGNVDITMQYDTSAMEFVSGDTGVTDNGDGTIEYSGTVQGQDLLEFNMTFKALIQGETRMRQQSATVTAEDGTTLDMEEGYADIAIVEGDGASQTSSSGSAQASSKKITVGSEEYTIASDFPENALPSGFAAADITYDGETVKGAKQEKGDLQLLYLLDSSNLGAFYIYNESKNACSPMQMINLSETSSIILLDDVEDVELPARYTKVELEISDDHSVPAWHDSKNDRFYLLYTVNTDGEKALYKYDSKDQTYQYYGQPTSAASASADTPSGIIGKITTFAGDHIEYVLIGAAFAILIFLLLIIILAVKLHRRNLELDDVYDELDELNGKKEGKAAEAVPEVHQEIPEPSLAKDVREEEPAQDDDFDDFESYDEDFEEEYDETYDDYEDEDYDDYDDYEDEDYEEDYDSDYYDDDYENYEEEYEERRPVRKQSRTSARKVKKQENDDDDDFSIDFIDL